MGLLFFVDRLQSAGRWPYLSPHRHIPAHPQLAPVPGAVRGFSPGLVAVRTAQRTGSELALCRERSFSDLAYGLLASLAFSTVIPAVFGTAELVASTRFFHQSRRGPRLTPDRPTTLGFFLAGWVMLFLMLIWPSYFFPFLWLSVYFILEPLNIWSGNRSLARWTQAGDWRPVYALWAGSLVTGFFWEFWNFWSYPKWVYTVPSVDFWHIFEMPLLGYGGYLPFALELHALYHLITGWLGDRDSNYIQLGS